MAAYQVKYIVQDLETFEFLYPDPSGGVGTTPLLNQAGHFEFKEDAIEAGQDLDAPFAIFTFYLMQDIQAA